MQTRNASRLGPACGLAFVGSLFVADAIGTPAKVAALLFLVPFAAYLASILRSAEGAHGWLAPTAFGAALVAVAVKLGSGVFVVASDVIGAGGQLDKALIAANNAAFMLAMAPFGLMVGAVAVVALRDGALPRWLGFFSAVTAIALLVNSTFVEAEFGPAFLLFALWIAVTSVALLAASREPSASLRPQVA